MSNQELAITITALVGFSILSWVKMTHIPFMAAGAISIMTAWFIPGDNTTGLSITIAIALLVYGILCFGMAYGIIFMRPKQSEGEE